RRSVAGAEGDHQFLHLVRQAIANVGEISVRPLLSHALAGREKPRLHVRPGRGSRLEWVTVRRTRPGMSVPRGRPHEFERTDWRDIGSESMSIGFRQTPSRGARLTMWRVILGGVPAMLGLVVVAAATTRAQDKSGDKQTETRGVRGRLVGEFSTVAPAPLLTLADSVSGHATGLGNVTGSFNYPSTSTTQAPTVSCSPTSPDRWAPSTANASTWRFASLSRSRPSSAEPQSWVPYGP